MIFNIKRNINRKVSPPKEDAFRRAIILKRIDENRKVLELLLEKSPDVLMQNYQIVASLQAQDDFLLALAADFGVPPLPLPEHPDYPRPMPSTSHLQFGGTTQRWFAHAYPLTQVTIKLQVTRHFDRSLIIRHLEEVSKRLKAGDNNGSDHDDDSGYTFQLQENSTGPSFFED